MANPNIVKPVAEPLRQPRVESAETAGSIATAKSRASRSSKIKLMFWLKTQRPNNAAAVKRITVRKTHLIDALSNPVIFIGSFGDVLIKRGYLTNT
jgi:hypothetical protein